MPTPTVVTIGNFDGVHLGHQAIVREARKMADPRHGRVVVLTFEPHPSSVLRPGGEPPRLTTLDRRIELLKQAGADEVHTLRPTADLLGQSPNQFIDYLWEHWQPAAIVEGEDFRFGKARAGDMDLLRRRGRDFGFEVQTVGPVKVRLNDGNVVAVGSSIIRWLVGHGRMMDAWHGLGRPYELISSSVRGEQRGRQIGVPTINLDQPTLDPHIIPADGVYAGHAQLLDESADTANAIYLYPAAISVGVKPTFGQSHLTVEAHLLDLDPPPTTEIYGQTIHLTFNRWLRDQYPYPDLPSLQTQLNRDIERTRQFAVRGLLNRPTARAGARV